MFYSDIQAEGKKSQHAVGEQVFHTQGDFENLQPVISKAADLIQAQEISIGKISMFPLSCGFRYPALTGSV